MRFHISCKVDILDVASKFQGWLREGVPELGKCCMGLGATTGAVLRHPQYSSDPHKVCFTVIVRAVNFRYYECFAKSETSMELGLLGIVLSAEKD